MSSVKFTLTREIRNEISEYIDNAFIDETLKETINYIKTTGKVEIDDSFYDEEDPDSRVQLIDKGPFNIYDYIYFKDFTSELSWNGFYFQTVVADGESYKTVYRYEPKDVGYIIYAKVAENMDKKKNHIYKLFKEKYNEEFLFNSIRFYKRTRDGKEYYELNIDELNPDKKRSLEERIKTELGNAFKSRWGSSVESKVSSLDDMFMLDIYERGCRILDIPNDYFTECVHESHSESEKELINIMTSSCRDVVHCVDGIQKLKMKVINTIDKRIDNLLTRNIYVTDEHMHLFLEEARKLVFGYYKTISDTRVRKGLKSREESIIKIIRRMAAVEEILYNEYIEENEKAPSLRELEEFKECIPYLCFKGVVWTAENIYIKKKAKDDLQDIIMDNPIDEYEEARNMERHFYLHVGETNTGKTYSSIQRLMEAETGVYLAPLRLLALEIQDKLNSLDVPCSLLTGEEEDIIPYAGHVSSTIEKLQTGEHYDVCVIDEAQMLEDPQRGWAWTRAIIAVLSPEVHICMAP
ncbi:MAG: RNA helicase, partial [Clostridium sp.]